MQYVSGETYAQIMRVCSEMSEDTRKKPVEKPSTYPYDPVVVIEISKTNKDCGKKAFAIHVWLDDSADDH